MRRPVVTPRTVRALVQRVSRASVTVDGDGRRRDRRRAVRARRRDARRHRGRRAQARREGVAPARVPRRRRHDERAARRGRRRGARRESVHAVRRHRARPSAVVGRGRAARAGRAARRRVRGRACATSVPRWRPACSAPTCRSSSSTTAPSRSCSRSSRARGRSRRRRGCGRARRRRPAARRCTLSGSGSARDSSPPGSSQFSPGAPGSPPSTPHGPVCRRSVTSDSVASSSTSRSRSMPSPPGNSPAPPLPRRSVNRRTRSGSDRSSASTGVSRVFVIAVCTPLMPGAPGPAALPAADRLVVHPARVAEQHVVHRPLPRRAEPIGHGLGERAEAHVGHALAHLDVAGTDRRRVLGGDDRAARRVHDDRSHRAAVRGNRRVGRAPQRERDRAHRHRLDRVDVAGLLRAGPGEVEARVLTVDGDRDDDRYGTLLLGPWPGAVERILEPVRAVGDRTQRGAHAALAVVDDLLQRRGAAEPRHQLDEARRADRVRTALRGEVVAPLRGRARARRDQLLDGVVDDGRRDAQALLLDHERVGRHRAGRDATDVGVVGAVRGPAHQLVAREHRCARA